MRVNQNQSSVTLLLALSLWVSVLPACKLSGEPPNPNGMFDGAAMIRAGAALKEKLGAPFKVLNVEIVHDSVKLRAQDPKQPANVDEYQYWPTSRSLRGPTPVELSSLENNLDNTLFDFDSVNWAAIGSLVSAAIERTHIDGGKVTKITIERALAIGSDVTKSGSVRWTLEVNNSREHATATADAQGRITRLDLSHTARAVKFNLYSPEALRDAVSDIDATFGGKALVMDIHLWDKSLRFKARDPETKEISQYYYDINGVGNDVILDLSATDIDVRKIQGSHKLDEVLFALDSIGIEQAPEFGRRAIQRLGFENARISSIGVKREELVASRKLITFWEVNCQAGRKGGTVDYDLNGKELGINTW
jgi:hypothetical protein